MRRRFPVAIFSALSLLPGFCCLIYGRHLLLLGDSYTSYKFHLFYNFQMFRFYDSSTIQNDDLVSIFDRRNALCNDDLGGVRNFLAGMLSGSGIRLCIYCTGRVIQNQDLWFSKERPCDTQTLLLTTGYIVASRTIFVL